MVAKKLILVRKSVANACRSAKYVTSRSYNVWTQDKIIKSPYKDVVIPNLTLTDYVWENLDKWPERTCAVSFYVL